MIPFSSAIFLAKGDTNIRPDAVVVVSVCAGAALGASFLGASTLASFFGASSFLDEALPLASKLFAIPDTSVPLGPIIANNESTLAESPSSNPMYNKFPD